MYFITCPRILWVVEAEALLDQVHDRRPIVVHCVRNDLVTLLGPCPLDTGLYHTSLK